MKAEEMYVQVVLKFGCLNALHPTSSPKKHLFILDF